MADGFVQVPPDSLGKKIDTSEMTRSDGTVVERQRIAIPDDVTITSGTLHAILTELRLHTLIFASAFNVSHDLRRLREAAGDEKT